MRLYDLVILPAAELASTIQLSTVNYEFRPPISSVPMLSRVALEEDLDRYTLIDVLSRKKLTPKSPVVVKEDGTIGRLILLLEPSLHRLGSGTNKSIELRKAVHCVKLAEPLKKRNRAAAGR